MKYNKFKKLPKKQKTTIILFWGSLTLVTCAFYGYILGDMIYKLLK